MLTLIKLSSVLVFLIICIKARLNVGGTLLLGSLLLGLLFNLNPAESVKIIAASAIEFQTIKLYWIVLGVSLLGAILNRLEKLDLLVSEVDSIFGDRRFSLAAVPAFIGLLPMPGGALVSAPFVESMSRGLEVSAEYKTVLNYWFRHIWEYSWPLYPAIILSAALFETQVWNIVYLTFPYTLFAILFGALLLTRFPQKKTVRTLKIRRLLEAVWPVAAIIIMHLVFKLNLAAVLIFTLALVVFIYKVGWSEFSFCFNKTRPLALLILVWGVMGFKTMIKSTDSVEGLPTLLVNAQVPVEVIVFCIPFLVSLLTGLTVASVGTTFPFLLPLIKTPQINASLLMIAYIGAYLGILLSPVHLCLVLTRQYFSADWVETYKKILQLVSAMALSLIVMYLVGYPFQGFTW
ncbi:MAG: DUF401 family protein [Candidatus Altiarchaeales archaeon]|nr:DUF401 family protein [Candidatus Altiarchaeales archaeon]